MRLTYHHRPDLLSEDDIQTAWLVYLADQICLWWDLRAAWMVWPIAG